MLLLRNALACVFLWLGIATLGWAAPEAELWAIWERSNESSQRTIDHAEWQGFLDRYLVASDRDVNRVRYGSVSRADRAGLRAYLGKLQNIDPRLYSGLEQKAYWINFYNAATVLLVVEEYPVDSIREIRSGWFSFGPWDRVIGKVSGVELTLNDIEHRILRPIFRDPLVHFGLNCASVGCPDLIARAYTANDVDTLLKQNAASYLASTRGARFDGGTLVLSSIFDWFAVDFGGEAGVLKFVSREGPARNAQRITGYRGDLDYVYDWSLNDAR